MKTSAGGGKLPQMTTRPWPTSVADKAVGVRPRKTLGRVGRTGLVTAIPAFGSAAGSLGLGPATKLWLHSVPVGRSCRAVKRQLPSHRETLLLPGTASLTQGRGPTLELSRMKDAEHLTFSVAVTLSPLKLTSRMFILPLFWPLLLHKSKVRGPRQVWYMGGQAH